MKRLKQLIEPPQSVEPTPARMMRCHTSAATNNPYPLSVRAGMRLPEDHELVKRWGWAFIPDELGDDAAQAAARKVTNDAMAGAQAVLDRTLGIARAETKKQEDALIRKPIPIERQRLCIKWTGDVGASVRMANWRDGEPRGIRAGEIADAKWRIVKENPERFVPILPDGLAVEDALVCVADEAITLMAPDGSVGRRVLRGQMVSKDDPLVELHPTMFWHASAADQLANGREPIFVAGPDQIVSDVRGPGTGREPA